MGSHIHGGGQCETDFDVLMQSPYMFARKFDEKYFGIVEKIFNELNEKNKNNKL